MGRCRMLVVLEPEYQLQGPSMSFDGVDCGPGPSWEDSVDILLRFYDRLIWHDDEERGQVAGFCVERELTREEAAEEGVYMVLDDWGLHRPLGDAFAQGEVRRYVESLCVDEGTVFLLCLCTL